MLRELPIMLGLKHYLIFFRNLLLKIGIMGKDKLLLFLCYVSIQKVYTWHKREKLFPMHLYHMYNGLKQLELTVFPSLIMSMMVLWTFWLKGLMDYLFLEEYWKICLKMSGKERERDRLQLLFRKWWDPFRKCGRRESTFQSGELV